MVAQVGVRKHQQTSQGFSQLHHTDGRVVRAQNWRNQSWYTITPCGLPTRVGLKVNQHKTPIGTCYIALFKGASTTDSSPSDICTTLRLQEAFVVEIIIFSLSEQTAILN